MSLSSGPLVPPPGTVTDPDVRATADVPDGSSSGAASFFLRWFCFCLIILAITSFIVLCHATVCGRRPMFRSVIFISKGRPTSCLPKSRPSLTPSATMHVPVPTALSGTATLSPSWTRMWRTSVNLRVSSIRHVTSIGSTAPGWSMPSLGLIEKTDVGDSIKALYDAGTGQGL